MRLQKKNETEALRLNDQCKNHLFSIISNYLWIFTSHMLISRCIPFIHFSLCRWWQCKCACAHAHFTVSMREWWWSIISCAQSLIQSFCLSSSIHTFRLLCALFSSCALFFSLNIFCMHNSMCILIMNSLLLLL